MTRELALAAVLVQALGGCAAVAPGQHEPGDDQPVPSDGKFDGEWPDGADAVLEIHAMDLWAQYLPGDATLTVEKNGAPVAASGPVAIVPLRGAAGLHVSLAAPDHETLAVDLVFDGTRGPDGLLALPSAVDGRAGLVVAHRVTTTPAGDSGTVHSLYLGLRHLWFSAEGRPARRGNDLELLLDGEQAWSRVRDDLEAAADSVLLSTWWWESDFELTRPAGDHVWMTEAERRPGTILAILDGIPATKRVLVGQFLSQDGLLSGMTVDAELVSRGVAAGDGFEYMGQANETSGKFWFAIEPFAFGDRVRQAGAAASSEAFDPEVPIASTIPERLVDLTEMPTGLELNHASYHQKFAVIDHQVAYIGGMNLRRTDWDTSEHRVFEPRRMLFESTLEERLAVERREALPDAGPRKDYMVRIEGPAAQDAADVFKRRWDLARAEGVAHAASTSAFEVERDLSPVPGGVQAQVTATLPDPLWEHAIAETWLNAVAQAKEYVLIEDQYFRAPLLTEALVARMTAVPGLRLIVVTKPIDEWTDPGCAQTYRAAGELAARFPDRFLLLQLRTFDHVVTWGWDETEARFADIDVHSKLLVADDVFLSVGSANKNNRGMVYEGELNVAVLDRDWVRAARRRILASMLPPDVTPADGVAAWWQQLAETAARNDAVAAAWDAEGGDISLDGAPLPDDYTPRGFVHSLVFRAVEDCLIEDVGEDMFKP